MRALYVCSVNKLRGSAIVAFIRAVTKPANWRERITKWLYCVVVEKVPCSKK